MVRLQCEGVGKDSIPGAINFDIINDMIQVTDKQSFLVGACLLCACPGCHSALCINVRRGDPMSARADTSAV